MITDAHSQKPQQKKSFGADESGNVGMVFGLGLVPVMFMLGATADYTRYATTRSALRQATDVAVLTVASKLTATTTDAQAKAQAQVILNAQPRMSTASITTASIATTKQTFCATSEVTIQNSFMQMARVTSLTPSVTSCADLAWGANPNATYEVALVVDNSGSMLSSDGSVTKISALKTAAKSFVDTMFAKAPDRVQFSVTPFAGAVVAVDPTVAANRTLPWIDTEGDNSQHWLVFGNGSLTPSTAKAAAAAQGFNNRFDIFNKLKQRNSAMDWRGCFEAPAYPKNVQDIVVSSSDPETQFVPYLAPDEPSGYDNNNYIDDNGGVTTKTYYGSTTTYTCSDTASGDWSKLTHVCKYKPTATKSGNYGPTSFFGPNAFCPDHTTQKLLQLTTSQTTIKNKIDQLVANGNTNLHEGFMWGWRTISPNGPFAAGRPYATSNNRKVMVFMTDGFNNWSAYPNTVVGSDYEALGYYTYNGQRNPRLPDGSAGDRVDYQNALKAARNSSSSYLATARDAQDELTLQACTNAKNAGVEVFTIGFSTSTDPIDAQGLELLKSCATNVDHYFAVENANQLNVAFSSIGIGLGKLRLSQ